LLTFGHDPRHLGGTIGVTAILHTWGQNLAQHLHLHCLVTGGALAPDGARWIPARARFLFPVRALGRVFRGKFLDALQTAYARDAFTCRGTTTPLADARVFAAWVTTLRTQDWVVYAKRPFAEPEQVLAYLGRYTHRVAISNARLVALTDTSVQFRWKDYADRNAWKVLTLSADEFLRRFLLHILPARFMRIRHFGLLANRRRATAIARCRELLAAHPDRTTAQAVAATDCDSADRRCPVCHVGHWVVVEIIPRGGTASPMPAVDSS
jgi:hypothetical protein